MFNKKKALWDSLSLLAENLNYPWLIMGDFNDFSSPSEKFGGHLPCIVRMNYFNKFLNACNLIDLGFIAPRFTWTNNRENGYTV